MKKTITLKLSIIMIITILFSSSSVADFTITPGFCSADDNNFITFEDTQNQPSQNTQNPSGNNNILDANGVLWDCNGNTCTNSAGATNSQSSIIPANSVIPDNGQFIDASGASWDCNGDTCYNKNTGEYDSQSNVIHNTGGPAGVDFSNSRYTSFVDGETGIIYVNDKMWGDSSYNQDGSCNAGACNDPLSPAPKNLDKDKNGDVIIPGKDQGLTLIDVGEAFDQGMSFGSAMGTLSTWLGGWEKDRIWLDDFQQDYGKYMGIDAYISQELCQLPTDENQVSTDVFFSDGTVGAHLEGYALSYSNYVYCDTNASFCDDVFNPETPSSQIPAAYKMKCFQGYCADASNKKVNYDADVYRMTMLFSPSDRVLRKSNNAGEKVGIKFYVKMYTAGGESHIVDLNHDNLRNSDDQVRLARGGEDYQKATAEFIYPTTKEYSKVCMEFEGDLSKVFTDEFYMLYEQVKSDHGLCNSFVNEGTDVGDDGTGNVFGSLGESLIDLASFGQFDPVTGLNDLNITVYVNNSGDTSAGDINTP